MRHLFVMVLEWLPVPDAGDPFAEYQEELGGADYARGGLSPEASTDRALHDSSYSVVYIDFFSGFHNYLD